MKLTISVHTAAPLALRVVARSIRIHHRRFSTIIYCCTSIHWLSSSILWTSSIPLIILVLLRINRFYEVFVYWKNFVFSRQLNSSLSIVGVYNSSSVPFELTFDDYDNFIHKWILNHSILSSNSLVLSRILFNILPAKYFNVVAGLNENSIRLNKLLIPQKQIVSVTVTNSSRFSYIWSR